MDTLKLCATHADWLANSTATYRLVAGVEKFSLGRDDSQMAAVDKAAATIGDSAAMITELREHRSTTRIVLAREVAQEASASNQRWIGNRYIEVLRENRGSEAVEEAEQEVAVSAAEVGYGLDIIEAIRAIKTSAAEKKKQEAQSESPSPSQEVTIAQIVTKRDAVARMLTRATGLERDKGVDDELRVRALEQAGQAESELNELVLRAIAAGKVPGRQAAAAALPLKDDFPVDALEQAREDGVAV